MKTLLRTNTLIISLITLATPTLSFANFFIGAGAGYINAAFHKNITIKSDDSKYSSIDSTNSVNTKFFAGYGWSIHHALVGARFNYTLDNISYTHKGKTTHDTKDNIQSNLGIDMLLGYGWSKWMPYILAGWQLANYSHTSTNLITGSVHSQYNYLNGFQVGLGLNYQIAKHVFTGLNYSYARFQTHTSGSQGSSSITIKVTRPIIQQVTWEISYNF